MPICKCTFGEIFEEYNKLGNKVTHFKNSSKSVIIHRSLSEKFSDMSMMRFEKVTNNNDVG